jgi:hypothetical protein
MSKRHPDGLSKFYERYPTNEEIERDFGSHHYDACVAIQELHDYLMACHKDGLLKVKGREAEAMLDKLEELTCYIDSGGWDDFELDLPKLPKELTDALQTGAAT